MAISELQFCMVLCVMLVLRGFFDIYLLPKNNVLAKIIALGFLALLVFYNYKLYTPKIKEMEKKFAKCPANKWLKDWLFFPSFNLDISIFYLRSFYCEQFVEIVNKGGGCYNNRSLFPIDTFKLGEEFHRRMREFEVLHLGNVPLNK